MVFQKPFIGAHYWLLAMALGLSGCAVDMAPPVLDFDQPAHYEGATMQARTEIDQNWGALFGNKDLIALLEDTRLHNDDLAAATARVAQAQALEDAAFAPMLPSLSGSSSASDTRSPGTLRSTSPPFSGSHNTQFSLGLSASYVLDIWGRARAAYQAQQQLHLASSFDQQSLTITTLSLTAATYMNLVALRERIAVGENNIKLANRILTAINSRLDVGTASALDVAQQEGVVASQKAALPPLRLLARQAENQLAVLSGHPPVGFAVPGHSLASFSLPKISAGLPSALLMQRPDIASAEANLFAAQANVAAARRAFFPTLSLTASGGLESLALKNLSFPQANFSNAVSALTLPIFDGGALSAQLALSTARQDELLADYRKSIISAFADVENALSATSQGEAQIKLQKDVLGAAQRAYTISEERMRAGTIDIVTLLNVQQTMFTAQDAYIQTHLTRLQASLSLIQALGGGIRAPALVSAGDEQQQRENNGD